MKVFLKVNGNRGLSMLFPETAMILPSSLIRASRVENFSLSLCPSSQSSTLDLYN
jgi:hypothetical protein